MKIKISVCIVLAFAMLLPLFSAFSASASEITVAADGFDTARGEGQLIIYTPAYGSNTATNQWGYEVIVEDGKVVSASASGNSAIPGNGFVLSGHNMDEGGKQMGKWLKENVKVGDYVSYNEKGVVTVSDQPIDTSKEVFYTITAEFAGTNITRQENTIVIYNSVGGRTGTNNWGYEVTVENGYVTVLGGYNSPIPSTKGSFVVSGHGTGATWLRDNVVLGMKVKYSFSDGNKVTFEYNEESAKFGVEVVVSDLYAEIDKAKAEYRYIDYGAAESAIKEIESNLDSYVKQYLNAGKTSEFALKCDELIAEAESINLLLSESTPAEYRGVWVRPTQKSTAEVDAYVEQLYNKGINMISVETLYNSTMIMPMPEDSLFVHNPLFGGFDVLGAYIDSCHKRGMELHIWLPIFYVADINGSNYRYSVAKKKPEWLCKDSTGQTIANTEGFGMLNPGDEEARAFLLSTYEYILTNYDIDGFQLDYIRYYDNSSGIDYGYNESLIEGFKEKYPKYADQEITYNKSAAYWNDWAQYRRDVISEFVGMVRRLIDEVKPGVMLSADVVPDPTTGLNSNYQDYASWVKAGYLDLLHPMAYGYGYYDDVEGQVELGGTGTMVAVGMGIFTAELLPGDMQVQGTVYDSYGAYGEVYFEASTYLKKNTGDYLLQGLYRDSAIPPALNPDETIKVMLDYASRRINDIILPAGDISSDESTAVTDAIGALKATVTESAEFGMDEYGALVAAIAEIENESVRARITADIKYALMMSTVLNKELDLSDIPDAPEYIPPVNESEPEISDTESNAASDSSESSDNADNGDNGGNGNLAMYICFGILALCAVALAVFLIFRKK